MTSGRIKGFHLPKQSIGDVLLEMYRLELTLHDKKDVCQERCVIIRLVTIIEQFFRNIVQLQLENDSTKLPADIPLSMPILDEIIRIASEKKRNITKEFIIPFAESFQNTKTIQDTMKSYGRPDVFQNLRIEEYDKLFNLRHEFVHTLIPPSQNINLKQYHTLIEDLIKHVLDKSNKTYIHFYFLKGEAVRKLADKNKKQTYFENMVKYLEGLERN